MRNRDFAKSLIDQIPDEAPNAETLEAFAEIEIQITLLAATMQAIENAI